MVFFENEPGKYDFSMKITVKLSPLCAWECWGEVGGILECLYKEGGGGGNIYKLWNPPISLQVRRRLKERRRS